MKYFYKIVAVSTLLLVVSCSEKKEEIIEPVVEPEVEVSEPVIEEIIVEEKNPLVYTVQIGAFKNANVEIENANADLIIVAEDGLTKYRLGDFSTYQEATRFKENLSLYPDAFIVATNNDVRIDISEALSLSNED